MTEHRLINLPRLLYVEDDEALGHLVKRRISKQGYQIEVVLTIQAAFECIAKKSFDLLIVDYQLSPEASGLDFITQLNEQSIDIPTIMVSGQDDIRVAVEALNLGCMDYLIKDGHSYLELLPLHIQMVIERRQLAQQKQYAEQETAKAQQSLARAQKLAKIGNWEWYVGDETAWWSDEHYEIFGIKKSTIHKGVSLQTYKRCIHPNDFDMVNSMFENIINNANERKQIELEYRICLPDHSVRWVHSISYAEFNAQGELYRLDGTIQDISARKASEYQLTLAQRVFENTTEAIMVADANKTIISINPAFTQITGYEENEVIGEPFPFQLSESGKQDAVFIDELWHELDISGVWSGEVWSRNKSGEIYPEWLSINVIANHRGEVDQYVSIFSDISQHKKAEQIIEYQANYDALTNLPNRNLFNDRLNSAIKAAERNTTKLALMFLDLDRFKWVNDSLGHRAGDLLLQETAQRLTTAIRQTDSVSRLAGDEFTIILNELIDGVDAEIIAEKILYQLSQPYLLDDNEVFISGSIGITIYPDDTEVIEDLFRHADTAMYAAKDAGRNRYSFFTSEMQQEAEKRSYLLNELHIALEEQMFELHYQPIVDVRSGQLHGAEALLRWSHSELGYIPPEQFIPLAEETGLSQILGEWVVKTAVEQIEQWQNAGYQLNVSINKFSKQFHGDSCADELLEILKQKVISPSLVSIDITESILAEHQEILPDILAAYKEIGISISLDDFGTGISSLSHLRLFPFDTLKIDNTFIKDLPDNREHATLVETIIMMGHQLGFTVLAEGVETAKQHDFLLATNCDFAQGFLYSHPIPAEVFEQQYLLKD